MSPSEASLVKVSTLKKVYMVSMEQAADRAEAAVIDHYFFVIK